MHHLEEVDARGTERALLVYNTTSMIKLPTCDRIATKYLLVAQRCLLHTQYIVLLISLCKQAMVSDVCIISIYKARVLTTSR